jgi:acetylornithine deacetylase/succinyl-diaminopimelate desuccinylase-like protein
LARGLNRLSAFHFPVHLTDTTKLYFQRRAVLESGQVRADMLAMAQAVPPKDALQRLSSDVETDILLRTTCTTTMIEGGHAENALPQRARATVQCRIVPGESPASIQHTLSKVLADSSIHISSDSNIVLSPESQPTPKLLQAVEQVVHSMWPGVAVMPQMSPGASDSIYTRAVGMPTYGIDGMFTDIDDDRYHGRDERIGIGAFKEELEFTYRLMRVLSEVR